MGVGKIMQKAGWGKIRQKGWWGLEEVFMEIA